MATLIAHDPVQHPTGLLRVHQVHVDITRRQQCPLDGRLRNLVKQHAKDLPVFSFGGLAFRRAVDLFGDMPGDRFAFAVGVGSQIDLVGSQRFLFNIRQHLCFALDRHILRLVVMFEVDAEFARREVLDVADGRHHGITPAEVFGDGARFRGRFDDD